jgi:uncharacterized oligopeptide transporter (OPT) family protein
MSSPGSAGGTSTASPDNLDSQDAHIPSAQLRGTKPPGVREFRVRTFVAAAIVAVIMGAAYPYIVLKLGFGPNVSVVAAFFGYLILGIAFKDYNRWENNIVQTAGTSAAQTAFMCVLLAAFDMLAFNTHGAFTIHLSIWQSFSWLTAAGLLGVLMAIPLRQHYVVDEKLTYADGVAAGETLIVLDSRGPTARTAALAMGLGAIASAAHMAMREGTRIVSWFKEEILLGPAMVQKMGVGFSYSLLSIGSGLLVGLRINVSMMLGGLLSWVGGLYLATSQGWIEPSPTRTHVLFWVMWPATGMLVAGGLTALALRWRVLIKTFQTLSTANMTGAELPLKVVGIGVAISATALVIIQKANLGIPVWMTLAAILLSVPLMLVGLRVLGETNWGPISALSNMMQGVFALLAPGHVAANMTASGTTGTVATCSEAIMQDYKAGDMIGSTPRYLAIAQLLAVPVGALTVSVVYPILRDTYGVVGDNAGLTSPISAKWAGFAEILRAGFSALPTGAVEAMIIFAVLGVLLTWLESFPKIHTWVPSPTSIGIGMLVPFNVVSTMFLGGLGGYIWEKLDKKSYDNYSTPLASGMIAGEAVVAVIAPVLDVAGVLKK